ncbi:MAG: TonB-dependent receptor [Bacteroidetes bacterium]|nr:TonB-dependent receptor [Bacteroidota bacterium]
MKKLLVLLSIFFTLPFTLLAQNKTVKGKVTDDAGLPVANATVTDQASKKATQTDKQGSFSLSVPGSGTIVLRISSVGFTAKTVTVTGNDAVAVQLTRETITQEDVVVVGYSTVRRRDLTASVSSISSKDLKDIPLNSAAAALSGRLAGVQVVTSEGAPGADVDIYIRGRNSITQSGSPLYIVDGIQIDNALNVLSPQDIQTIDVLKDAAATAIYGARGSNGVVLITTKGGKNTGGKTTVTYNGFMGVSTLSKELDFMDPYNFVLYSYERAKYTENPADTAVTAQYIKRMSNFDTIKNYINYPNAEDWQKRMLGRNAMQSTHNISVTGGTAATQYNVSATLNKQEGLIQNSDYERKLLNFRFDHRVSDRLKIGFNTRFNQQKVTGAGTSDVGGAGSNRLRQYTRYRPLILPGQTEDYYDQNLDVTLNPGNGLSLKNPIQLMNAEYRLRTITTYNYNGYINYNFTKNLSFRSTFGYDVSKTESRAYDDTLTNNSIALGKQPVLNLNTTDIVTINNSNVFSYSNPSLFKTKHSLDVLVGQEIYQTNVRASAIQVNYFPLGTTPDQAFANLGLASPPAGVSQPKPASSEVNTHQLSFFSRINYSYNRRYLLTLNFRADGSSLFGPDYSSPIPLTDPTNRKWGYFPSASFAWRLSEENFMKSIEFISSAKVRLSYGASGNNRISAYGYTTGYAPPSNAGYGLNDALAYTLTLPTNLGNPEIKWESLTSKNLGLDLSFFNNRLNLTADFYSNTTKNLLLQNKIPPTSGYTTQFQNVGTVRNNGLELQLGAVVMQKKDFTWNASFNIAFNKNKIISLGKQDKFTANSGWFSSTNNPDDYLVKVGGELGTIYGLQVDGFYNVNDFDVTPYVNATNNARYPTLLYQYKLKSGLANPAAVLNDLVAPGQIKYRDVNGDGKITLDSDRVAIGHVLPKFTGGFNQQFAFKGFDASIFLNFSVGNDIFNANKLEFANQYGQDQNMLAIMNGRWRVIDQNGNLIQKQPDASTVIGIAPDQLAAINAGATIWQPYKSTGGYAPMSFAVEDGSYLRINNITIGYTIPKSVMQRVKVTALRFYVTANNVATITGYSGYDPDVSSRRSNQLTPGVDYAAYPRGRTVIAGVNLTF